MVVGRELPLTVERVRCSLSPLTAEGLDEALGRLVFTVPLEGLVFLTTLFVPIFEGRVRISFLVPT